MNDHHVYKKIELTGSSPDGLQQAIENAVAKASETLRQMRWFELVDVRGHLEEGAIAHWQATIKIGFALED